MVDRGFLPPPPAKAGVVNSVSQSAANAVGWMYLIMNNESERTRPRSALCACTWMKKKGQNYLAFLPGELLFI